MKIIDGENAVMGRLASYVAKQALQGEEISIVNCNKVLITGNKKFIENKFYERRQRVGSTQKGPKISRVSYQIVKRCIKGMLPNHRGGRGKIALGKIKCYDKIPKELENKKMIKAGKEKGDKFVYVESITKKK